MLDLKEGFLQLDQVQQQVVDHDGGPLLVLGSPGTGKSSVLVERWVRLATTVTQPHRILLLVPTRERALTLRDELPYRLEQRAVLDVPVHTWHALAYHLVTRYYARLGFAQPPVLLTNAEQWTTVRDLLRTEDQASWGMYSDYLDADAFVNEVADFCVRAGYRAVDDAELARLPDQAAAHTSIANFTQRYRDFLKDQAQLDYPQLMLCAARLLEDTDEIRAGVAKRFPHVLVDDAHELTPVQLRLLRCLATDHLVCAADPDSSIETFRGANPAWLKSFGDQFGAFTQVHLPIAHRFGKTIAEPGRSLIAHARESFEHRASDQAATDGVAEVRCFSTVAGEIEAAARVIRSAHLIDGVPYEQMAVLVAQPSTYTHALKRVLTSLDVPYHIEAGDRPLVDEPAVRAVLDLCRLVLGDEPSDDLTRAVLNSPLVDLHPYEIRELERAAFKKASSLLEVIETDETEPVAEFRHLTAVAQADPTESADATLARVFEASRWCKQLTTDTDFPQSAHHLEALKALARALGHFVERRPGATMRDYVTTSADAAFANERWSETDRASGVNILSLHAAKGAEWDVVCVLGIAEGLIPRPQRAHGLFDPWALEIGSPADRAQAQLAEERRTLYIALTRARQALFVSASPGTRRAAPSRFIEEAFGSIPEPILASDDQPPLTLAEVASRHRRTLARHDSTPADRAAAAAALASIPDLDTSGWWWRRGFTDGAPLTKNGKLTTSYSRIGNYDNCPLQYVLQSVLGLDPSSTYQMKFGSLIHKIFEDGDTGAIASLADGIAYYKDEFTNRHRYDYPNIQYARTYYTAGIKMLKLWWAAEKPRGEVVKIEYSFNDLDVNGHTIRGRIDRITKTKQGLVLTDYKTSRTAVQYEDAEGSLQLAIYYRAAQVYDDLNVHGAPARMQLVYPGIERHDRDTHESYPERRTQRPEQAEEALVKLASYLDLAASEDFNPSPEADCRWCSMKLLCPRFPEGREVPK